jgi:hypothetical protein
MSDMRHREFITLLGRAAGVVAARHWFMRPVIGRQCNL